MQQNSDLMSGLFFNTYGAPLDDALMQKGYSIKNVYDTTLTEENFSAYSTAREHINSVNFYGKLNRYLDNLIEECWGIHAGNKSGNIDELVAETYRVMKMDLAES